MLEGSKSMRMEVHNSCCLFASSQVWGSRIQQVSLESDSVTASLCKTVVYTTDFVEL